MNKTLKTALIVGGTLIGLLVLTLVFGLVFRGGYYGGWGMMGPGMMGTHVGMGLMPLAWIIVLGLIIWVVIASVRSSTNPSRPDYISDFALDILKRRYAQGEISKEEYIDKKRNLA